MILGLLNVIRFPTSKTENYGQCQQHIHLQDRVKRRYEFTISLLQMSTFNNTQLVQENLAVVLRN
jgi:hypothetical protein